LCAGPHLENTSELNPKALELESSRGLLAGDETKAQLQRIYATAWETPEQLSEYKRRKEEALRRDHRRLGKELGCFFSDEVDQLPGRLRNGVAISEDFLSRNKLKRGYHSCHSSHHQGGAIQNSGTGRNTEKTCSR